MDHRAMYIDGRWQDFPDLDRIEVENPADERVIATIPEADAVIARQALSAAKAAQRTWAARSIWVP